MERVDQVYTHKEITVVTQLVTIILMAIVEERKVVDPVEVQQPAVECMVAECMVVADTVVD